MGRGSQATSPSRPGNSSITIGSSFFPRALCSILLRREWYSPSVFSRIMMISTRSGSQTCLWIPCTLWVTPGYSLTGLTLAYNSRPERRPRMVCPPAISPLGSLASGQPMAPRRIASDSSLQYSKDPAGHSSPVSR